jgi:hypothetical protein
MSPRTLAIGIILVLGTACDPAFGIRVGQRIRPSPGCVDSALHASSLVAHVAPAAVRSGVQAYEVVLNDPSFGPNRNRRVDVTRTDTGDTSATTVAVTARWIGTARLPPDEERLYVRSASQLLGELRHACSPASDSALSCTYVLRRGSCRTFVSGPA